MSDSVVSPDAFSAARPNSTPPRRKLTVPGTTPAAERTLARKINRSPGAPEDGEVNVVVVLAAAVTVKMSAEDLEPTKATLPAYLAMISWGPTGRLVVVTLVVLAPAADALSVPRANSSPLRSKTTVPGGGPLGELTEAVKTKGWPAIPVDGPDRVVAVGPATAGVGVRTTVNRMLPLRFAKPATAI